jgi:bis(5'-nucleosyl)-tetraphosphatase (symmetrical)
VQGCFDSLQSLLTKIQFDPAFDRILFTGDLVNRGPKNLETLQFVKGLGRAADAVLGNHDLHLIGRYFGLTKEKKSDTLNDILKSRQAPELLEWLMGRPFVLQVEDFLLVHAGFGFDWTLKKIESAALKMSEKLHNKSQRQEIFGNDKFPEEMRTMTTIRVVDKNGERVKYNGPPELAPPGNIPWFIARYPQLNEGKTVIFGHWAALGARKMGNYISLDSGCVWGGKLSALRLSDRKLYSVPAVEN